MDGAGLTRLDTEAFPGPSWRELNRKLGLLGHPPAELEQVRANLIVDGQLLTPFAEEAFLRVMWHDAEASVAMAMSGLCVRCAMPNFDLASAEADRQPLALLTAMSRERGLRVPSFGVNGAVIAPRRLDQGRQGQAT